MFSADLFFFFFPALQHEYGVCAEIRTSVQLTGQREEAQSSPLIHQLPQQMEPASLLSTTVHIPSKQTLHSTAFSLITFRLQLDYILYNKVLILGQFFLNNLYSLIHRNSVENRQEIKLE